MTGAIPAGLLIHTVTWYAMVLGSADAHGNQARTYPSGTSISGRMQQDSGSEPLSDGRDPLELRWTLFTNQDGISGYDRIVFDGKTFEVDGPPAPQYGASGFHHSEVALRKVDG